jgi:hypothetical protein
LRGKNKGLGKLAGLAVVVSELANDLDDNVIKRGLRVDIRDPDFALLEANVLDERLNVLWVIGVVSVCRAGRLMDAANLPHGRQGRWRPRPPGHRRTGTASRKTAATVVSTGANCQARRSTTYVKLVRVLAQGGVVLLDKVPSNLVLGQVAAGGAAAGGGGRVRDGGRHRVGLGYVGTVGCHCVFGWGLWLSESGDFKACGLVMG